MRQISFRLEDGTWRRCHEAAKADHRSMTQWLACLVERELGKAPPVTPAVPTPPAAQTPEIPR